MPPHSTNKARGYRMDLVVYQLECQNTKSNKFFGDRVTKSYFENALFEAIEALTRLDAIKKSLFYGKDSLSYDVNGNHRNIDCNSLQIHALHNEPQAGLDILHGIIGKATESGELLEALMNAVIGGQKLDPVNLVE
ncbi:MAG TPA: hypothetical protein VHK27_01970, partial [Gammaproteobacteria bacterium]|nr:hypothetical protein [Gammaproteobacteria bacterium]